MKNFKINSKLIIFFVFCFSFAAFSAQAAVLYFSSLNSEYSRGDIFKSDLKLNTQGEAANTCDIKLSFDPMVLEVLEISKGGSILSLWPQEPMYSNKTGEIYFAGGTPGGFNGDEKIISIIFRVIGQNPTKIFIKDDPKILLNDGAGTEAKVAVENANLNILPTEKAVPINEWGKDVVEDKIQPKQFEIKINKDSTVFGGKYFIVFSTVDNETGIDHYEIKEGDSGWKIGSSPYVLEDQTLKNTIWVKAIDFAGNEMIKKINPGQKNIFWIVLIIIGIFFALLLFYLFFKKLKSTKK